MHGKASGIDNTIVTYGGLIRFNYCIKEPIDAQLDLLVVNSNTPKKTNVTVEHVRKLRERFPQLVEGIFNSINEISAQLRDLLLSSSLDQAKQLLNMNHGLLYSLGVSSPDLDNIVE